MDAVHFVGIFLQVEQVPFVTFGEVYQFVICGAHAEVLRHAVFAVFIIGCLLYTSDAADE